MWSDKFVERDVERRGSTLLLRHSPCSKLPSEENPKPWKLVPGQHQAPGTSFYSFSVHFIVCCDSVDCP